MAGGQKRGLAVVSVTDADQFARLVRQLTGSRSRVFRDGQLLGAPTVANLGPRETLGPRGQAHDFDFNGNQYRGRIATSTRPAVRRSSSPSSATPPASLTTIARNRLVIGGLLIAFLLLASSPPPPLAERSPQQIDKFLVAARRLAARRLQPAGAGRGPRRVRRSSGASSTACPSSSRPRSRRSSASAASWRRRSGASARRSPPASTARRRDLAVRTAVEACEAEAGRALPLERGGACRREHFGDGRLRARRAPCGSRRARGLAAALTSGPQAAARRAPRAAWRRRRASATVYALAVPLLRSARGSPEHVGVLSIARRGRPFTREEEELFAATSPARPRCRSRTRRLHETVQRQAVTDELTGLSNLRHFHETLEQRDRAQPALRHPAGLVMLDIDDFKKVNDTYGHQQGDVVLREVARVLRDLSRDIDEPGPLRRRGDGGGPAADRLEGAELLAERMREAIEALEIERARRRRRDAVHRELRCGVAPECAHDPRR